MDTDKGHDLENSKRDEGLTSDYLLLVAVVACTASGSRLGGLRAQPGAPRHAASLTDKRFQVGLDILLNLFDYHGRPAGLSRSNSRGRDPS